MCQLKSGIILRNKCVLSQEHEESHSDLLSDLKIEDTLENARRVFVRAELVPPDGNWWTDPDTWTFNVDQDILPDWYTEDPGKYEQEFRESVKDWVNKHVFIDKVFQTLPEGYFLLKGCTIDEICTKTEVSMIDSTIKYIAKESVVVSMSGDSVINLMCDDAKVLEMRGKSKILIMSDNTTVLCMKNETVIDEAYGHAVIKKMYGKSLVQCLYDKAVVHEMYRDAAVKKMRGTSVVCEMKMRSVVEDMRDESVVQNMFDDSMVKEMHSLSVVCGMYGKSVVKTIHEKAIAMRRKDNKLSVAEESSLKLAN